MFPLSQNYEETKNFIIMIPSVKIPDSKDTVVFQGTPVKKLPYNHRLLKVRPRDPHPVFDYIKSSLLPTIPHMQKKS